MARGHVERCNGVCDGGLSDVSAAVGEERTTSQFTGKSPFNTEGGLGDSSKNVMSLQPKCQYFGPAKMW